MLKFNHFISGGSFHSPTPSPARFLLLPFLWTRGWRAAWFPLHSGLARERESKKEGEIKSDVVSGKGRNNSQVIVIIIIVRKKKFLITVNCCCANKATSIYSLISLRNAPYSCNMSYTGIKKSLSGNYAKSLEQNDALRKDNLNDILRYGLPTEIIMSAYLRTRAVLWWRVCCQRIVRALYPEISFLFIALVKGNTQRAAWQMIGG